MNFIAVLGLDSILRLLEHWNASRYGSLSPEFRVDLEHSLTYLCSSSIMYRCSVESSIYVTGIGGLTSPLSQLCNRDRCIDTSVTLGHGGVPVDHRLGTWALGRDPRMYAAKRI